MKNKESDSNILRKKDIAIMRSTAWDYGGFHQKAGYFNKGLEQKKYTQPIIPETPLSPVRKDIIQEITRINNINKADSQNNQLKYGGIPRTTLHYFDIIARAQAKEMFENNRNNDIQDIDEEPMNFSKPYTYEEWAQIKEIESVIKQKLIAETLERQEEIEMKEKEELNALQDEKQRALQKWEEEKIARKKEKQNREKLKTMKKQAETITKMKMAEGAFEEWLKRDEENRKQKAIEKRIIEEEEKERQENEQRKVEEKKREAELEYQKWKAQKDETISKSANKQKNTKENRFPYSIHDIFNVPEKVIAKKMRKRKQKRKKKHYRLLENANNSKPPMAVQAVVRPKQDDNIHIFDEISSIRRIGDNSESGILFANKNQLERVEEDIHNTSI